MLVKNKVRILGNQIWVEFEDGLYQCDTDDHLKEIEARLMSLLPNVGGNEWNPMTKNIEPGEIMGDIEIKCLGFNDVEEIVLHNVSGNGIDWEASYKTEVPENKSIIPFAPADIDYGQHEIPTECIISLDEDGDLCVDLYGVKDKTFRQLNAVGWRVKQ